MGTKQEKNRKAGCEADSDPRGKGLSS